ncbi:unnamed protein product [Ceratitis capitata]|uniref:(Mediterranean fruit fly) hypothetical protein n=1 Tax=Ceratitis capitata TaxID=7213 RepID=A0A811V1G1_CERCA|nr:unnamed protein product [Ceratitis capitata]
MEMERGTTFEKLKKALTEAPVLSSPDFPQKFILQTDARDFGLVRLRAVEFIVNTGETASNSDSDEGTFGMMRAPTPIVISSNEEEEVRRGEMEITDEKSQRPGDEYTEYICDDRITNKQSPQQRQAIENTTRY